MSSYGSSRSHAANWLRLRFADPGGNRLRSAATVVASMAAAVTVAWGFAKVTDQLRVIVERPDGSEVTVVVHAAAMMVAALLTLVMVTTPLPGSRKLRATTLARYPILFYGGTVVGTVIGTSKLSSVVGICVFAVLLVLLQRWPALARMGLPTFFGLFTAIFTGLELHQTGWVALVVLVAGSTVVAVQVALCPNEARMVQRTFRSFEAAAQDLLDALSALLAGSARDERLRARVVAADERVAMLALLGDGQLSSPLHGLPPETVGALHVRTFDQEAVLSTLSSAVLDYDLVRTSAGLPLGVGDAFRRLAEDDAIEAKRAAKIAIDTALARQHDDGAESAVSSAYRMAAAIARLADIPRTEEEPLAFEPGVRLAPTGALPGTGGPAMALYVGRPPVLGFPAPVFERAVRMAAGLAIASAVGYALSSSHWYYATFGAFTVLMSANSTTEHFRIGMARAVGTALGAIVGVTLSQVFDGHLALTYAALFTAMGVAFYFKRPSDTINTFSMTVMVTMLYLQLHNYSDTALWDRVFETAIGGAAAGIVSLVIFRVPAQKIARSAADASLSRLSGFLNTATAALTGHEQPGSSRAAARRFQESVWTLGETVAPAPFVPMGTSGPTTEAVAVLTALADDAARLARDLSVTEPFAPGEHARLEQIGSSLSATSQAVGEWLAGRGVTPVAGRIAEIPVLDYQLRSSGRPEAHGQLRVLSDLSDIEEHLLDLVGADEPRASDLTEIESTTR